MTDEERKEYRRAYYLRNKDKFLKSSKKWKENNKDRVKEINREYNKRHSNEIKEWAEDNKDSRLATYKKHYQKHKLDRQKNKVIAIQYKGSKCVHCGIPYNGENASIFDFHHVDPSIKDTEVSKILNSPKLTETIKKELDKCILVCSNCHRLIHNNKY